MSNEASTGKPLDSAAITAALAAQRANKEGAESSTTETTTAESGESTGAPAAEATTSKRKRLTDEERAARDAERAKDRADRKAKRDEERAQKKAQRQAERDAKVPHMAKVEKQAQHLPVLNESAQVVVSDITSNYGESQIAAIVAHLAHALRVKATESALDTELTVGQLVRIVAADPGNAKWVGHVARVTSAARIRCYVQPLGTDKKVYLFSSNVRGLTDDEVSALPEGEQVQATAQTA